MSVTIGTPVYHSDMANDRRGHVVALHDGSGYVLGGAGGFAAVRSELEIVFHENGAPTSRTKVSDVIAARWIDAAARCGIEPIDEAEAARLQVAVQALERDRLAERTRLREESDQRAAAFAADAETRIPPGAVAVIVAELVEDKSDYASDYHGGVTVRTIILAFSSHERDLFPELRKAALNHPETASLASASAEAEHREKYSMGGGYYLKDGYRYDSGWKVRKVRISGARSIPVGEWSTEPPAAPAGAPASVTVGGGFRIEQHQHAKRGFAMSIVIMAERVERERFEQLRDAAKDAGGWYSRAWGKVPAGFAFKDPAAAATFAAEHIGGGDVPQPPASGPDQPPRRVPAARLDVLPAKLRALADAMQAAIDDKFRDRRSNTPKQQREAQSARLDGYQLQRAQKGLRALADCHEAGTVPAELAAVKTKAEALELARGKIESSGGYYDAGHETGEPARDTPAARAFWALLGGASAADRAAEALRAKIDGLRFAKIPGYFPTPPDVVARMIEAARLPAEPFLMLEPSAGSGAILDQVREAAPSASFLAYERNFTLREILEAKGYGLAGDDFTESDTSRKVARALMNPPFENGQDMEHVRRAFDHLEDGGRMVSIMSPGPFFRTDAKARAFRDWFDDVGGERIDLPAGAFKSSGTGVASVLVIIDRDDPPAAQLPNEEAEPVPSGHICQIAEPVAYPPQPTSRPESESGAIRPIERERSHHPMTIATTALAAAAAFACTLDRKAFAAVLAAADKVTEARNTIPILSTVRLELAGDVLTVEATDLDMVVRQPVAAAHATAGAVCVDLKAMRATVRKMTGERVRLQYIGARVMVTDCDTGGAARLGTLPAADWPDFLKPCAPVAAFTVPAAQLAQDFARIKPAISTEETRYYLNGIHFHAARVGPRLDRSASHIAAAGELEQLESARLLHEGAQVAGTEGQDDPETVEARAARMAELRTICEQEEQARCGPDALRMVATDGHRLHYVTRPLPDGAADLPPVILPRKAVAVAAAIMGKKALGDVTLEFTESRWSLRIGEIELRGKLIDGSFPDYTRVIPSQNGKRLTIGADELATLVESATAHCTEKSRAVKLSLCAESVIFSATSPETGTAAVQAVGAEFAGDDLAIGFNASYLVATAGVDGQPLTVALEDEAAPTLFTVDGCEFEAVLMPMRVGSEGFMRPADIAKLNQSPFDAFADEIAPAIAVAVERSAQTLPRDPAKRKAMNNASRTAWQEVARLCQLATGFLEGNGVTREAARAAVRSAIIQARHGEEAAAKAEQTRIALAAAPSGSFAALGRMSPAVAPEPVHLIDEPQPEPEPVEAAPAIEEPAPEPPAPAAADVQDALEPVEATAAAADPLAALAARVEALEAMLRGQGQPVAEISPPAPDPTAQDLAPIEDGERAELVAEIDRLRATVADQAARIDRLTSGRDRTARRLRFYGRSFKREARMNDMLTGQIATLLKRREEAEQLPPAKPLPAALRPPAIALPVVASRPRQPVEA